MPSPHGGDDPRLHGRDDVVDARRYERKCKIPQEVRRRRQ